MDKTKYNRRRAENKPVSITSQSKHRRYPHDVRRRPARPDTLNRPSLRRDSVKLWTLNKRERGTNGRTKNNSRRHLTTSHSSAAVVVVFVDDIANSFSTTVSVSHLFTTTTTAAVAVCIIAQHLGSRLMEIICPRYLSAAGETK